MQLIKLNTLFDKFETFLKSSLKLAGLLMRFVIIISIIMMTSCAHEDITIETIRDETAVAETDTSAGNKNSETDVTPTAEESVNKASSSEVSSKDDGSSEDKIFVYICGAVNREGVYELPCDSRIVDVLEMAGGMTEDACHDYVNLAEKLVDGEKIYIPTAEEVEANDIKIGINEFAGITSTGSDMTSAFGAASDGRIDINHASKEELITLSGIGAGKAEDIIAYREANGGFESTEDIMNVSGIGKATFDKIKDRIKVD